MKRILALPVLVLLFLCGCSSPSIITKWKDRSLVDRDYNKILVIGILKDSLVDIRRNMENNIADQLKSLGYTVVTALDEFGPGGLLKLEQEQTYTTLCNKGIDAVITIALLDKDKQHHHLPSKVNSYSSQYYYNRIWNYRSMQENQVVAVGVTSHDTEFLWEALLFDLATLTPAYSAQTKPFNASSLQSNVADDAKMFTANMVKNKVLSLQPAKTGQPLKAF